MLRSFGTGGESASGVSALTRREFQVLKLVALGNSTRQIAEALGLSAKTVDNHRSSMMRKLDVHNVASMTRYAIEHRIIEVNFAR